MLRHAIPLILLLTIAVSGESPPTFEQYPATSQLPRALAPLQKPEGSLGRKYRTVLSRELAGKPNFAGHLSIVDVGGGTGLHTLLLVDFETGEAFQAPSLEAVSFSAMVEERLWSRFGMEYRADSRLLIVRGIARDACVADHYFVLQGRDFALLHRVAWPTSWNLGRCAPPANASFDRKGLDRLGRFAG